MYIGSSTKKKFVSFDAFIQSTKCSSSATVVTSVMQIPLPLEVGEQVEEYSLFTALKYPHPTSPGDIFLMMHLECIAKNKLQSYRAGQF